MRPESPPSAPPKPVKPVQRHQRTGDAAAPFAGVLLGCEMGTHCQRIAGLHVVKVQSTKVGTVLVIAVPLHAVGPIALAQVAGVWNLHFVCVVTVIGVFLRAGAAAQQCGAYAEHKGKYN